MPTKVLDSQTDRKGLQDTFSFGGGKNTVFANDGEVSPYGYIINTGGGDDIIYGSGYEGPGNGTGDPLTETGDLLIGGDGTDMIFGGGGDDVIYGGHVDPLETDDSKGQNPAPTNTLVGDGERQADGTISNTVSFATDLVFNGGNDTINGGTGSFDNIFGDARFVLTVGGSTFNGGDDTLSAGDGGSNNLVGDAQTIQGPGTVNGGNDTLISGTGSDTMVGDWAPPGVGFTGTAIGGSDTFVFGVDNGFDSISDFEAGTDLIDLSALGISFSDFDIGGVMGVLDAGDTGVTIGAGTTLNLGLVSGGDAFGDQVVVSNVIGLVEADFVFV